MENFQQHFFLACFVMQDVCTDHYHVKQMKGKFLPPFYCLSLKWIIGRHLVRSVQTSLMLVVQQCSWFYFTMCPLWWWCLNKYIFMGSG
jgi:hypothetical protein